MFITGGLAIVLAFLIPASGLETATAQGQPSKIQPLNTHYHSALADLKGGNTDKATLEVKLALQENPLDAASHFLLGCLLERKGERDQAIMAYQRAVEIDSTNPDSLYNLGTMLLSRGFSTKSTTTSDTAVIILVTPRDPAFTGERNRKALTEFTEKRRAFLLARQGTEEDMRRYRERYPDWDQFPPNRFASHIFLMENSEIYRVVSGQDLVSEDVNLELLGPKAN